VLSSHRPDTRGTFVVAAGVGGVALGMLVHAHALPEGFAAHVARLMGGGQEGEEEQQDTRGWSSSSGGGGGGGWRRRRGRSRRTRGKQRRLRALRSHCLPTGALSFKDRLR